MKLHARFVALSAAKGLHLPKFVEIFLFEFGYQGRRPWTWLYFVALLGISLQMTLEAYTDNARVTGYYFNGPFVIASVTMLSSVMALLVTAALSGEAAARDVQTRMHPLMYTSPIGTSAYVGGRFLAAFVLNAIILLSVQVALLLTMIMPGVPKELFGPFQPVAYVAAFAVIALTNAFVGTALLFSIALLSRRAIASYLGGVVLFFSSIVVWQVLAGKLGSWEVARLLDPLGLTALSEMSKTTTSAEKNSLTMVLSGGLLVNRAIWMALASAVLALASLRFRFENTTSGGRRRAERSVDAPLTKGGPIVVPPVVRTFGFVTHLHQTVSVAMQSFRDIAFSWGGLILGILTTLLIGLGPRVRNHMGVPLLPTTQQMTEFVGNSGELLWTIVPLLTVFYVGELVWRERDAGMSEIADATPAPEWVRFVGRFIGLGLVFAAYQLLLIGASMLIQVQLGYYRFEPLVYARTLLGLQLPDHLLFALLAFFVHVLVNQKYIGHMVVIIVWAFTAFAATFGIEHHLAIFGSDPGWSYSDMRGFGPFIAPWLWFKLYWGAWALLFGVVATLLWVRGRDVNVAARLRAARLRLSAPTIGVGALAMLLIVACGGFILYNTTSLNAFETSAGRSEHRAEYERQYGKYRDVEQPRISAVSLQIEIYPERRDAVINGTYRLVNSTGVPIDSIHLAPESEVETGSTAFDRASTLVLDDRKLSHRIYALGTPLQPGDSLQLRFALRFKQRGFTNEQVDAAVAANGTYFEGNDWLPAIGYQARRELTGAGTRREYRLPVRALVRSLDDVDARGDMKGKERVAFDATIGTTEGQIAMAPGALRRTWSEGGRRYFHYATDVPIRNDFAIYSAAYAVRDAKWGDVAIQIVHHPEHATNVDRMVKSAQASLDYFSKQFGPYPHKQLRLIEHPSDGNSLHASPINISYEEGFSLFDPDHDPRELDFPFAVVAHEVAHQWWGNQLSPADVEGAPLLTESLAWYSAMCVVRETYGDKQLAHLLSMLRESFLDPRSRAGGPLLRAYGRLSAYRTGPFALYAVREYVGADRLNLALRRLLDRHRDGRPPLPTSLDLYRELQAVTPDSLRYLLADLFEANTYWELKTKRVASEQLAPGRWSVALDIDARKVVVDTAGIETEIPMNDLIEVGVYGAPKGDQPGKPLALHLHRMHSGEQRITLEVSAEPFRAGIDPRNLLIDVKPGDNVKDARP